jgi:hypothetical protein
MGRLNIESPPRRTMMMEITMAMTGCLMKNLDITGKV